MAKKKKSVEQMLSEIIQDRLEMELHKQFRKARKGVIRQREKTKVQAIELQALPMPDSDIIEAETVNEESHEAGETDRGE